MAALYWRPYTTALVLPESEVFLPKVCDSFVKLANKLHSRAYSVCMRYTVLMAKSHKRELHI